MAPDDHALLSASGAHRRLNCPPSAILESREPDSTSEAAEQGTVAHALAEWKLRRALHHAPTVKPESDWIDQEMEDRPTTMSPSSKSTSRWHGRLVVANQRIHC